MNVLTRGAIIEEAGDALGYVDDSATAAAIEARMDRQVAALDRLPGDWAIERSALTENDLPGERAIGARYALKAPESEYVLYVIEREGARLRLKQGIELKTPNAITAFGVVYELAAVDAAAREGRAARK